MSYTEHKACKRRHRQYEVFPVLMLFFVIFALLDARTASSQSFPSNQFNPPSHRKPILEGLLDLKPSEPLGMPPLPEAGISPVNSILVDQSFFPELMIRIPNLEFGYLYAFGNGNHTSRLIIDYIVPIRVFEGDVVFFETHGRFEDFFDTLGGSEDPFFRVLFGGGYRKRLTDYLMVGINGFYNTSRVQGLWYRSALGGIEVASVTVGGTKLMFNFNAHGDLFGREDGFFWTFKGIGDAKAQLAYQTPLYVGDRSWELKLKVSRYWISRLLEPEHGGSFGAEVLSKDGVFRFAYETGYDEYTERWNTIGVYFRLGFDPMKLVAGENPFSKPY